MSAGNSQLSTTINPQRERLIVGLAVAGYILLALAFSLGPIFEGPDEVEHYRFIRTFTQTWALPDPYTQVRAQYHQAPLYYWLTVPLALLTNDTDFPQIDGRHNPYYPFEIGIPGNDNKNLFLHTRAEAFPYSESGTARAVHLIRLLSIALGACTVLTSYAIFLVLWPSRPDRRLMALGLVAFMPQFLYLSGTINNDNLLYLLTTLTLFLLLRLRRDGPSRRWAVWLGVVLGAALLTKVNAAFLVFPVGLAILLDRRTWRYVPLIAVPILVIAGWWYVRNTILYGDPTAVRVLLETWQRETIRSGQLALDVGLSRVPYGYQTFWARFGQGAVAVAQPIYGFFNLLTINAIIGSIVGIISIKARRMLLLRDRDGGSLLLVIVFGLSWVAALIYYASTAWSGNQGRYLLPGIAAWGALFAFGFDTWTPRRFKLRVALSSMAVLALIAAICVFSYFLPSYSVWPVPAAMEHPIYFRYGDTAELIGMSPANPKASPGAFTRITLYWRALHSGSATLQSYLHTTESDVVKRDSLPATGNLLASDWRSGDTWAESYVIHIPNDAEGQMTYPLVAGLYDPATKITLPVIDKAGSPAPPIIGRIIVTSSVDSKLKIVPRYQFDQAIGLLASYVKREGDQIKVCLDWQSIAPVSTDYTVFVHLLAGSSLPIAQADSQPKGGRYPTSIWTPGEAITKDCHTLDAKNIPQTGWQIVVGLYDAASSQRLPMLDRDGKRVADDAVVIQPDNINDDQP